MSIARRSSERVRFLAPARPTRLVLRSRSWAKDEVKRRARLSLAGVSASERCSSCWTSTAAAVEGEARSARNARSTQLKLCSILSKGGEEGRRKRSGEREPTQILREVTGGKGDLLGPATEGCREERFEDEGTGIRATRNTRRRQAVTRRRGMDAAGVSSFRLPFSSGAPCGLFGRSAREKKKRGRCSLHELGHA